MSAAFDAHTSFAAALWWQKNWPLAERDLRRAIQLNPGHVTAHTWYALLLSGLGQPDEALRESRRAFELDPFSVTAAFIMRGTRFSIVITTGPRDSIAGPWRSALRGGSSGGD